MRQSPIHVSQKADPAWRIGIVASSFYKDEIDALVQGARDALTAAGLPESQIRVYEVPGSFEIPLVGAALAEAKAVDALIGIGIIVEGQTQHARLLADQSASGIMQVQVAYQIPFAFEILYVDTLDDARARSTGSENKGAEAAYAVLQSLHILKAIQSEKN